jgi:hypothetical protein
MAPTPRTRDAGIGRISRLTRWALVAAVGASALVSFVVAKAQVGSASSAGSTRPVSTPSQDPGFGDPGTSGGLRPPASPPRQAGGGGLVNSGGS